MPQRSLSIPPLVTLLISRFELLVIVVGCGMLHIMILIEYIFLMFKQDYISGHHVLALTMKEVLAHEVSDAICGSFV